MCCCCFPKTFQRWQGEHVWIGELCPLQLSLCYPYRPQTQSDDENWIGTDHAVVKPGYLFIYFCDWVTPLITIISSMAESSPVCCAYFHRFICLLLWHQFKKVPKETPLTTISISSLQSQSWAQYKALVTDL